MLLFSYNNARRSATKGFSRMARIFYRAPIAVIWRHDGAVARQVLKMTTCARERKRANVAIKIIMTRKNYAVYGGREGEREREN